MQVPAAAAWWGSTLLQRLLSVRTAWLGHLTMTRSRAHRVRAVCQALLQLRVMLGRVRAAWPANTRRHLQLYARTALPARPTTIPSQILCARVVYLASLQRLVTLGSVRTVLLAASTQRLEDRAWKRARYVHASVLLRVLAHHHAPSALAALRMRTPIPPHHARHVQQARTLDAARPSAMSALRVRWTVMVVPPHHVRRALQVSTGNRDRPSTAMSAAASSVRRAVRIWISTVRRAAHCATQASTRVRARLCALSARLARSITTSMRALHALRALLARCGRHDQATPSAHVATVRWVERTRTVIARLHVPSAQC